MSFSVVFLRWPLRMNFLFSHPALVRETQNMAVQKPFSYPRWVGGFYVSKATSERGSVCFWTDTDESGRTGIIYQPNGGQPVFNLWSSDYLGENWHVITED